MKILVNLLVILVGLAFSSFAKAEITGTYGLHLFFNEKEFVDVIRITKSPGGQLVGDMVVPNDFSGKLLNIKTGDRQMTFDLFVPKNSARPKDLVFSYRLLFFDHSYNQFVGFVNLHGQESFVASFVGFKRSPSKMKTQ